MLEAGGSSFDGADVEAIALAFEAAVARYESARVKANVPLLVERDVRARLRQQDLEVVGNFTRSGG